MSNGNRKRAVEKRKHYLEHWDNRRTEINVNVAVQMSSPVREGRDWVIRDGDVEIRNRIRLSAQIDYATIKGYKVVDPRQN